MKRLWWVGTLVFLAASVASVGAQSLAEIAKKEKERRENNDAESSRTITDTELSRAGGPMTTSTATFDPDGDESVGEDTADVDSDDTAAPEAPSEPDPEQTREYWQNRVRGVDERIRAIEAELQSPELTQDPRGAQTRQRRERDLDTARAERQRIVDEARRKGVPPGWLR